MTPLTFTPPFPIGKYNYKQESNFLCQRCKTSYKNRQGKMSHYLTAKHATYCQPPKSFDEFLHKPAAILRKQQNYTISNALHNQWIFNISSFWQSNQLGRLSNNHQQCLSTLLNDFHLYCISNFFFFWIFFFFLGREEVTRATERARMKFSLPRTINRRTIMLFLFPRQYLENRHKFIFVSLHPQLTLPSSYICRTTRIQMSAQAFSGSPWQPLSQKKTRMTSWTIIKIISCLVLLSLDSGTLSCLSLITSK